MNQVEIGKTGTFIAKCRKEKKLTQAQLAEKLNITDRAVSKWETGKSMPDSSIMLELCQLLGITVNELLSGEKVNTESYDKKADENLIAMKQTVENSMAKSAVLSVLFSAALFIGIIVCFICDIAISHSFTWSLIPASSIMFAWAIVLPGLLSKTHRTAGSLISLSIFILPYLYILSRLLKVNAVFSMGGPVAVVSVLFLWILSAIFRRMGKRKRFTALGISFLSGILLIMIINGIVSQMTEEPFLNVWNWLSIFVLLILAAASFLYTYLRKRLP